MTHASLFSGIGGFELAAEWAGFQNVFSCEIEEFNQRVLKHHFPTTELHTDVKNLQATKYRGRVSVLSGGFPCQPYSTAGLRKGKHDERHLWPEMLRVIQECQPHWVVGENVRGLVSWNEGLVFEEVHTDLEREGYEVQAFLLPAAGKNAPHRRDRIYFVAHSKQLRLEHGKIEGVVEQGSQDPRQRTAGEPEADGQVWSATNADSNGLQGGVSSHEHQQQSCSEELAEERVSVHRAGIPFERFPTQSPICGGDDGLPTELDGITFSKWRKESVKAYGNAIVPQIAYDIFESIKLYEKLNYESASN
jgi:DNA (cytosine-5)-methyltransferase 1